MIDHRLMVRPEFGDFWAVEIESTTLKDAKITSAVEIDKPDFKSCRTASCVHFTVENTLRKINWADGLKNAERANKQIANFEYLSSKNILKYI